MADALSDFEGLITEGRPKQEALEICARAYSVNEDSLAIRIKAFGNLNTLRARNRRRIDRAVALNYLDDAIELYVEEGSPGDILDWYEGKIGEILDEDTETRLRSAYLSYLVSHLKWPK